MVKLSNMKTPFALARVGIKGYEAEASLWNTSSVTVFHIMKRIEVEYEKVVHEGWRLNGLPPFYPFLIDPRGARKHAENAFDGLQEPINIFFILTRDGEGSFSGEFPDPKSIKWEHDSDRSAWIKLAGGEICKPLPDYIRVGGSDRTYIVLLVHDFKIEPRLEDFEIWKGRSWKVPISSGWRAFDVFSDTDEAPFKIIARGTLNPPFWGVVCPMLEECET
jgi:hypothetical protein